MHSMTRWTPAALLLLIAACTDAGTGPVDRVRTPARLVIMDPGVVRDGDVVTLRAEARAEDNSVVAGVPLQWSSTDPSVASVTPSGTLTALREGGAELVVKSGSLQQRRFLAVVLHPAASLELQQSNVDLLMGTRGGVTPILRGLDGRRLLNRPIALESSNDGVVRVTASMELIPVAPGTAVVTARYGTLSATTRVEVRQPVTGTNYVVRELDGRALPVTIFERVRSDNGTTRILELTRLEAGTVVIGRTYDVSLRVVHYERSEFPGGASERVMGRQTIRDFGSVMYDGLTGNAVFLSGLVGGLTHALDATAQGPRLRFREGGTTTVWSLGLTAP